MKLIFLLIAALCGLCLAIREIEPEYEKFIKVLKIDNPDVLKKQKDILRLLMHVHQPIAFDDLSKIAKTWSIESNLELYENPLLIKKFIMLWRTGYLPRGEIFSIYNPEHLRQAITLFNVMYYAKTYDTFFKTAVWAREYVNERMFIYVLTLAVTHRMDCKDIVLPEPYEIIPNFFITSDVMMKAYKYKMQNFNLEKVLDKDFIDQDYNKVHQLKNMKERLMNVNYDNDYIQRSENEQLWSTVSHRYPHYYKGIFEDLTCKEERCLIIPMNYTYGIVDTDEDQKLSYFLEDVGFNSMYYKLHTIMPFWMDSKTYGIDSLVRGERYYFLHQQLLARYYLERLSNGLGKIDLHNLYEPIKQTYIPLLSYEKGIDFPNRMKLSKLFKDDLSLMLVRETEVLEKRILDAIDLGYIVLEDGRRVNLYTEEGINILGNLVEGNGDSLNQRFYKFLHGYLKVLYGSQSGMKGIKTKIPSVLEHYETMLRDPMFWSIYKKIVIDMMRFKNNLPSYSYKELLYPGVKVENVEIDKLFTFFDYYDVELNNGIFNDWTKDSDKYKVLVKARQMRLNHKPFSYKIDVLSDKSAKMVIRVYLGPKYDEYGRLIDINENRMNFVIIDKFVKDITVGKNVIERNSLETVLTTSDKTSYYTLYKQVMKALDGNGDFVINKKELNTWLPERLMLPKGTKGGMPFQMFVMVTPYDEQSKDLILDGDLISYGIRGQKYKYFDKLPMGYPFDRRIDVTSFWVPNMYMKDVVIYHKRLDEIFKKPLNDESGMKYLKKPFYLERPIMDEKVPIEDRPKIEEKLMYGDKF